MEPFSALLYDLISKRLIKVVREDYIYADGTEQTLLDIGQGALITGYIDLSEMQAEDTVVLRMYVKVRSDADYKLYATQTYKDAQGEPIVCILPRYTAYGTRLTLQQTSGEYKRFRYIFTQVI
jgi:hypothetical protein